MAKPVRIRNGRHVRKAIVKNGGRVRNGKGSHRVGYLNDHVITFHEHGEYRPGMRHNMVKTLRAAGVLVAVLVGVAYLL